jgi:pimeloyl-ACP methyl ester carboxylesterase
MGSSASRNSHCSVFGEPILQLSLPGHRIAAAVSRYDGIGHAPFWEDAPRFNAELAAFVAARDGGGSVA